MATRRLKKRGRFVVAVAALALGAVSGAAIAAHVDPKSSDRRGAIQSVVASREWFGQVLAQDGLEPIAGVRIRVEPLPEDGLHGDTDTSSPGVDAIAITGTDGRFAFEALPGGRMRLSAPGFLDGFVLLHAGRDNDLGRLVMRHELSLSGRVLLDGSPVQGVSVLALAYRRNSVASTPTPETSSGADGTFHLAGIRPEQFRELVFIAGGVAESKELAKLGEPLEPRHYEMGDIELPSRVRLQGIVTDAAGEPVSGAAVSVSYSDSMRLPRDGQGREARVEDRFRHESVVSNERGEVFLVVAPGQHSLEVFHPTAGLVRTSVHVVAAEPATHHARLQLEPHVSLRGRVVDGQGNGLAGVTLGPSNYFRGRPSFAMPDDYYLMQTDDDGCYTIRSALPGEIFLDVFLPGYASRLVQVERPDRPVPSSSDGGCDDLSPIVLAPGAQLSGRVVNQLGEVVAGAMVNLRRHQRPGGYLRLPEIPVVTAGSDGSFVIDGLIFGDYSMSIRAAGHANATFRDLAIGPLPSDPSADRVDQVLADSPLTRAPDAELYSLDVTMHRLVPNVWHEVVVFDARGAPEPEARVDAWARDVDPDLRLPDVDDVFTGADGRAIFPELLPGTYRMTSRAPKNHDYGSTRADHRVQAEGLPTILTMPEHPPLGELYGRYVDGDGRGVAGATVHAAGTYRRRREARSITAPDGSFRFAGLPYGRYVLLLEHEDLPPVIHPEPFEVGSAAPGTVEIVVPAFGAIEGTVSGFESGEPGGVSVSASSEFETEGGARQYVSVRGTAAEDGAFRFAELAPGTWNVRADDRAGRRASATVELSPGAQASGIELAMPSGFTLTGTITWRGEPPERAWISAGWTRSLELSDPAAFEISDLQPGEQQIQVSGTGLRSPYFVYTRIDGDSHIDIVIEGGAVNGVVVDAETGAPIGGAWITSDPIPQLVWDAHDGSRRADRNGVFTAGPFPAGPWRFEVSAPGYAPRAPELNIGAVDIDDYVIELQPSRGLEIRIEGPPGPQIDRLYAAWFDEATGEVVSTQRVPAADEPATFHWPDGPTGRGVLSVTAPRLDLAARLEVEVGDAPIDVVLAPSGGIQVVVPEFVDHRPIFATLRVFDARGRPVPDSFATSHRHFRWREGPQHLVTDLVPGRYRVVVETSDGRSLSGEAEVRAFEDTELVLR